MTDPQPYRPDADTLATIDRWLAYRCWHSRVPGAQVAIGIAGEVVFSAAYGFADLEQRVPMTEQHLFRIASHSKTFTSTAVLQLVEQGRLGLEDPVGDHVPELADDPAYATITVRELLEHTAGVLRDGRDADFWQASRPFPEREELLALVRAGLKREPGELFAYSNLGYSLLGLVIESVTGQGYADATRSMIMEPLGLTDTSAEYVEARAADYASGYTGLAIADRRRRIDHVNTHAMASATGFTSTASDLVVYFGAHRFGDDRLLSDRSKRRQQRRSNVADPAKPEGAAYGLGMVHERVDDHLVVGHSGGYPGHITKTMLDPSTGLVVSVLTNATDGPAALLATGVLQLLDRAAAQADESTEVSEAARVHVGRYVSSWSVTDLGALGGTLYALFPAGWSPFDGADRLTETGPDEWLIAEGDGYGSVAEPVTFTGTDEVRYGGMGLRRFDALPERADLLG